MRTSRRKTLIGLAAIFSGGGVIAGSGAFSTVEAQRTVDVSTTGDSSSLLALSGNTNSIVDTETVAGSDLLTIENSELNERALTTFDDAFVVGNNGTNNVDFYVKPSAVQVQDTNGNTVNIIDFKYNGSSIVGSSNSVGIGTGVSANISISIDLRKPGVNGDDLDNISEVTFVANEQ
jgi:hypothetical protein